MNKLGIDSVQPRKVLITGITGMDGSHLAELLLSKGYEVHGFVRRRSDATHRFKNNEHILDKVKIHWGDLSDSGSIMRVVKEVNPDEIYNLAAHAHVGESFATPEYSVDVNGIGVIRFLEAIRMVNPGIKFYQASTSELYGGIGNPPYNEDTPFHPQSPYTFGKLVGYWATRKYRESYGLFACNGILFNHEGERRGDDFLTRKVTKAVARIKLGLQDKLELGNMDAKRDWGYSPDFVEAAWLILQQEKPDDYVVGTGELHTVEEWVKEAFDSVGLNWKDYVIQNPAFLRPSEVNVMWADYSKAEKVLGWKPKVKFGELVARMVKHDLNEERKNSGK